ncbi:flavodoxin [Arthrobacter sp. USHLN218]|uniref:flavodoxin n=1 Tax=Arthrobacter sp. USHLN218 TaxID=3081232 RepID=UPI00301830C1
MTPRHLETGNTEILARTIADRTGCDLYRIEASDPYSGNYDDTVARNVREQDADARPGIAQPLPDIRGYGTLILASPIWNVRPPMIMSTFVDGLDVTGKSLLPVVTYAVSGLGSSPDVYRAAAPSAVIGPGLAVRGETVPDCGAQLNRWLSDAGIR